MKKKKKNDAWAHCTARRKRIYERAQIHLPDYPTRAAPPFPEIRPTRPRRPSRGRADYISEAMPRACCRRPVLPPPLPAQPRNVAAAAPFVVRRGRRSARCRLLSRTTSESARAQPREADGAIEHVRRLENRHLLCRVRLDSILVTLRR